MIGKVNIRTLDDPENYSIPNYLNFLSLEVANPAIQLPPLGFSIGVLEDVLLEAATQFVAVKFKGSN